MNVHQIREWNPSVEVRPGARTEFRSVGFCFYATDELCTSAESAEELAFARDNPHVAVVITKRELAPERGDAISYVVCDDPAHVLWTLHNHLATATDFYGAREPTRIHPEARVHPMAHVDAEGVVLEAGVVVEPFAVIYAGTHLEEGVKVCAGAVIGCDAVQMRVFGGERVSLVHRGGVRVAAGAEIGVHAVVCAGIFNAPTHIGREAYLGPYAAIAHEVAVGDGALVLTGAILFGTCEVEDGAFIAPGAIVSNHVTVGERAKVSPGALVTRDVEPETKVTGYFAVEHGRFLEGFRRVHGAPRGE